MQYEKNTTFAAQDPITRGEETLGIQQLTYNNINSTTNKAVILDFVIDFDNKQPTQDHHDISNGVNVDRFPSNEKHVNKLPIPQHNSHTTLNNRNVTPHIDHRTTNHNNEVAVDITPPTRGFVKSKNRYKKKHRCCILPKMVFDVLYNQVVYLLKVLCIPFCRDNQDGVIIFVAVLSSFLIMSFLLYTGVYVEWDYTQIPIISTMFFTNKQQKQSNDIYAATKDSSHQGILPNENNDSWNKKKPPEYDKTRHKTPRIIHKYGDLAQQYREKVSSRLFTGLLQNLMMDHFLDALNDYLNELSINFQPSGADLMDIGDVDGQLFQIDLKALLTPYIISKLTIFYKEQQQQQQQQQQEDDQYIAIGSFGFGNENADKLHEALITLLIDISFDLFHTKTSEYRCCCRSLTQPQNFCSERQRIPIMKQYLIKTNVNDTILNEDIEMGDPINLQETNEQHISQLNTVLKGTLRKKITCWINVLEIILGYTTDTDTDLLDSSHNKESDASGEGGEKVERDSTYSIFNELFTLYLFTNEPLAHSSMNCTLTLVLDNI